MPTRMLMLMACLVGLAMNASAAEPLIRTVDVRGLQVGAVTTLVVDGENLGKGTKLLLPFAATQVLKATSTEKKATFDVTLGPDITPGFYQCSVLAEGGVSLPVLLGVDHLPQKPFSPLIEQLPMALHGSLSGSQLLETKFQGVKGQQVIVEVEAQKLGSKLNPVLHLYDAKKLQVAWSWPVPHLFGDTRLSATLPEDGTYTITLHDLEYAAGAPGIFRMKVGKWEFIDQVFPVTADAGQVKAVELTGSMSGSKVNMPPRTGPGPVLLPWPGQGKWSGMRPFVQPGSFPDLVELPGPAVQELKGLPLGIHGKLAAPFEEDRYKLACAPKSRFRFDLFAERIGSPVDAGLVIRNDKGAEIARSEDRPGSSDPFLEFTIPDNTTSILVCVVDSQGRGDSRANYRLTVEDISTPDANSRLELSTPMQRLSLSANSKTVIPVWITRNGYAGKVDLKFAPMPKGATIEGNIIPADGEGTLLTVSIKEATQAVVTGLTGKSDNNLTTEVRVANHPLQRLQPWLAGELAVAPVTEKAAELSVVWRDMPRNAALIPGMKLNLPLKVTRADPNTVVRITLITSQNTPKVNNQPDPRTALRPEKALEIAAKATDAEFGVLVPVAPAGAQYDLTLQAELLSANKQVVLASAYAPVLRLPIKNPLVVSLEKGARMEATLDAKKGTEFTFKGKVERTDGLVGDINLAVTGLPAGARFEPATLKADKNDFDGKIIFPPTVMPNEYKVKLTASGLPDTKQPTLRVNSRETELALVVKPAPK